MTRRRRAAAPPGRRMALAALARLAALAGGARLMPGWPATVLAQGVPQAAPRPAGTVLVLLGTQGGPTVTLTRGEAASAVVVDGQPYLVDCGYGTLRALVQAGLRHTDVAHVFLTHLHNDHTADVAALLSHQWTGSRTEPTTVHGPAGTTALVDGAVAFFRGDAEIRTVDEGRAASPARLYTGRDVPASAAPVEVYRDARVTVRAVENTHFADAARARFPHRSLSYRFDTAQRSIVFSGDTAPSANLVALARDADVLVCEAMDVSQHQRMLALAAQAGPGASVARHVAETHSTTEDVGRMAAEARVKTVVLTHLSPGANVGPAGPPLDTAYIDAVRTHFTGTVILGHDQMRL